MLSCAATVARTAVFVELTRQSLKENMAARIIVAIVAVERLGRLYRAFARSRALPIDSAKRAAQGTHKTLTALQTRLSTEDAEYAKLGEAMFAALTPTGNPDDDLVATNGGSRAMAYTEAANRIRKLGADGLVGVQDLLQGSSGKLFWIHRVLAPKVPGGIGVRVTVQLNLFSGTVANLGDDSQRETLRGLLSRGELGCFALTEKRAGVLSGLVVDTTATYIAGGGFEIHTPSESARKVWISQGLTCEWGVVIARLLLPGGVDKGPHAFLVRLDGEADGASIRRVDMDAKTAFNDLDNAEIYFSNHKVPHSALLCGISGVDAATGEYQLVDPKQPFKFEVVAQRLLSGRICIPFAALSLVDKCHRALTAYDREVPSGRNTSARLNTLPAVADLLNDVDDVRGLLTLYVDSLQHKFMNAPAAIPTKLVDQIAAAKILVLDFALKSTLEMKGRVGAYALFEDSPFGHRTDLLYVFRFAEGDSNILMQKVARDALQAILASPLGVVGLAAKAAGTCGNALEQRHARVMLRLAVRMAGASGGAKMKKWLASHELVREAATAHALLCVRQEVLRRDPSLARSREMAAFDRFFA